MAQAVRNGRKGWAAFFRLQARYQALIAESQAVAENVVTAEVGRVAGQLGGPEISRPIVAAAVQRLRDESKTVPGSNCPICLRPLWMFDGASHREHVADHQLVLPFCGHPVCGEDALALRTPACPVCRKPNMFVGLRSEPRPVATALWRFKVSLFDPLGPLGESDIRSAFEEVEKVGVSPEEVRAYIDPVFGPVLDALYAKEDLPQLDGVVQDQRMSELGKRRRQLEEDEAAAADPEASARFDRPTTVSSFGRTTRCATCKKKHIEKGDLIVSAAAGWSHHACCEAVSE